MQYTVDGTSYRYIAREKGLVYGPQAHQLMANKTKLKAISKGIQVCVKQSFSGSQRWCECLSAFFYCGIRLDFVTKSSYSGTTGITWNLGTGQNCQTWVEYCVLNPDPDVRSWVCYLLFLVKMISVFCVMMDEGKGSHLLVPIIKQS